MNLDHIEAQTYLKDTLAGYKLLHPILQHRCILLSYIIFIDI
jgi:hypothetical protein